MKFESLSVEEKSKIMGRDYGKVDSNANPRLPDAYEHVGKSNLFYNWNSWIDGEYPGSQASNYHINRGYGPMIRQSWPFGTAEENGLAFLAFSRSLQQFDIALNRMLGINTHDESQIDNLFKISKPKHANYYYCPSLKQLSSLVSA